MTGIPSIPLSNKQIDRILIALKERLNIVLTCPARVPPGTPITAQLIPNTALLDASDLLTGTLDLGSVVKETLFGDAKPVALGGLGNNPDPAAYSGDQILAKKGNVLGGIPFVSQTEAVTSLTNVTPPQAIATDISGLLAQLFGTLDLPNLKVRMDLVWRVRDQQGNLLSESDDFLAPNGLKSPTVSVTVVPGFQELRLDTLLNPGGNLVCLSLDVTLSIGLFKLPFTLGPIPVVQLPLMVPTVVAMFTEPNFDLSDDSAVLIAVPAHSPLSSAEALFKVLQQLEETTSTLRSIAGLAGFFLGLDEVTGSLPQQPRIRFVASDGLDAFDDFVIKRRPWYNPLGSDRTFDDAVESLFVLGLPGTQVRFFNDEEFKIPNQSQQGFYEITLGDTVFTGAPLGDFFVSIRSLVGVPGVDNKVPPITFPPDRVTDFSPDMTESDGGWEDCLSSMLFTPLFRSNVQGDVENPKAFPAMVCAKAKSPPPPPSSTSARRQKPAKRRAGVRAT